MPVNKKSVSFLVILVAALSAALVSYHFWKSSEPTEVALANVGAGEVKLPFIVSTKDIIFEVGSGASVSLVPREPVPEDAEVSISFDNNDIIDTFGSFKLEKGSSRTIFIPVHAKTVAGRCVMSFHTKSKAAFLQNLYKIRMNIKVVHHIWFGYLSVFLGWGYFLMWGLVYYPQVYQNWRRRSVVGLSFDYLSLNLTGHFCFMLFNLAMYYNNNVQKDYHKLHPRGELPVKEQDVYFSVHAVTMNLVLVLQCLTLERGDQRIGVSMGILLCGLWISITSGLVTALVEKVRWLTYLYYLSYIKVGTTPVKYAPQVYLNFSRKSTEGWSVQSVMCDFAGGVMCFMQMATDAFNNDDWNGTLGNPGKLGLGLIAIVFDSIFLVQHFILYRSSGAGSAGRKRLESGSEKLLLTYREKFIFNHPRLKDPQGQSQIHRIQNI